MATLSACCQTFHLHFLSSLTWADTCSHMHTRTHTHAFSDAVLHSKLSVCHGKLGWRLSRLLGDIFALYGTFFFSPRLVLSLSLTDSTYSVPHIWMLLDVNSYESLLGPTIHTFFHVITRLLRFHMIHSFFPPTFGFSLKLNIFPWDTVRHPVEQKTRGKLE